LSETINDAAAFDNGWAAQAPNSRIGRIAQLSRILSDRQWLPLGRKAQAADESRARRQEIGQSVVVGIDEAMIERLIRAFYGRARLDPLIGPIFESKVRD
jgi:hypothetical protein